MNLAIALVALLNFLLIISTAVAISRQVPREKGTHAQAWRYLFAGTIASSVAVMILAFR